MEKMRKADTLLIGALSGIVAPVVTLAVVYVVTFDTYTIHQFFHFLKTMNVMTKLFSLCMLPNLGLFFLSLQFDYNNITKGILGATIGWAVVIVGIQFAF